MTDDQHQDVYCCTLEMLTTCDYHVAGQQMSCRGYVKRSDCPGRRDYDRLCCHYVDFGYGVFRCDNRLAQLWALDRVKAAKME